MKTKNDYIAKTVYVDDKIKKDFAYFGRVGYHADEIKVMKDSIRKFKDDIVHVETKTNTEKENILLELKHQR